MKKIIAVAALVLMATLFVQAQTAEDIINKHIKVAGGNKMANIQSLKRTATLSTQGMQLEMVIYQKRPNKVKSEITIPGAGVILSAYDGETAWGMNPFAGQTEPTVVTGTEADNIIMQADMDGQIYGYKSRGLKGEYAGIEEIGGTKYHKVTMTVMEGQEPASFFFEVDSGLLIMMTMKVEVQGMTIDSESTFSDYRKDGSGMLVAHRVEQSAMGNASTIEFGDTEYNIEIDDAIFSMEK